MSSPLDYFVVVDAISGTFFGAGNAVILDTRKLSDEQLDELNEGSDSERRKLACEVGNSLDTLIPPSSLS